MLIKKEALEVARAASKDPTRYTRNSLYIDSDGTTVATDGHIMMLYQPDPEKQDDPSEYPMAETCNPASTETLKPCSISSVEALTLAKAISKDKRLSILRNAALDAKRTNEGENAVFMVAEVDKRQVISIKKIDADFPRYKKILPALPKNPVFIGFNIALFKTLLDALEKAGAENISVIAPTNGEQAMHLKAKSAHGTLEAVIMPLREDHEEIWGLKTQKKEFT